MFNASPWCRALVGGVLGLAASSAAAQNCSVEELKNDSARDGGNGWVCPCFVPDEVAMAVLTVPEGSDGNELITAQILWDSFFGGPTVTVEKALIIYDMNQEGPVDPNTFSIIESIPDPELHRGFLNIFDLSAFGIVLPERRFGIGIKFANDKTQGGGEDQPSVISDFDGHNNWDNTVRNWVFAIPGGWQKGLCRDLRFTSGHVQCRHGHRPGHLQHAGLRQGRRRRSQ